jgi:hypothetical protein
LSNVSQATPSGSLSRLQLRAVSLLMGEAQAAETAAFSGLVLRRESTRKSHTSGR